MRSNTLSLLFQDANYIIINPILYESQRWEIRNKSLGAQIYNVGEKKCLSATASERSPTLATCTDTQPMLWTLITAGQSEYTLKSLVAKKCITAISTAKYFPLALANCNTAASEQRVRIE